MAAVTRDAGTDCFVSVRQDEGNLFWILKKKKEKKKEKELNFISPITVFFVHTFPKKKEA